MRLIRVSPPGEIPAPSCYLNFEPPNPPRWKTHHSDGSKQIMRNYRRTRVASWRLRLSANIGFGRSGWPCARAFRTSAMISSQVGSIWSVAGTNRACVSPLRITRKRCPRFTWSNKAPVCLCNSFDVIEVMSEIDTKTVSLSICSVCLGWLPRFEV